MIILVVYGAEDIMNYMYGDIATEAIVKLSLFRELSKLSQRRRTGDSLLRRAWRAVVRFWDQGSSSVDALYASKFDNEHFIDTHGSTVQYYGNASAFKPASIRPRSVQSEYQTLRTILGSKERFARTPVRQQDEQRKAS